MSASTTGPIGVCLLNMGGPATLDDVEPYLFALFSDRQLIRLPGGARLQRHFARLIARRRAPSARKRYAAIGGGSPLGRITQAQAESLRECLAAHGDFVVTVAMRYTAPRADEAVQALAHAGVTRAIALPLYPHYSTATSESSFCDLERAAAAHAPALALTRVADFHVQPTYVRALAQTVTTALESLDGRTELLFSAHSVPKKLIAKGDPYQHQLEACARAVADAAQVSTYHLGYQSRSGPVRWLEPDVLQLIDELGHTGCSRLVVLPLSFVSDHIETLHEIDIEMRARARAAGITEFVRAQALNTHPTFIQAMSEVVIAACQTHHLL